MQLCARHNIDAQALTLLREYVKTYLSPFPQNQRYMAELFATIDWQEIDNGSMKIRGKDLARFRAFGSFLQSYELPEILTWDAIEQALPLRGGKNNTRIAFIRSCLFELGELLAERMEMNDHSSHLQERSLCRALQRSPEVFLKHVSHFQQWLRKGMLSPTAQLPPGTELLTHTPRKIVEKVNSVARFLTFCVIHNTCSVPEIGPSLIAEYLQSMLWQIECKACHGRFPFESMRPIGKCANKECEAVDSCVRIRRLTRGTMAHYISDLRTFFDWAKLHKIVKDNPVASSYCGGVRTFTVRGDHGELIEIAQAIRRYDDAVVEKLCAYIISPEADPEDAVVLYLIIFHLLTTSDLRNLKIPSLVDDEPDLPGGSSCAKDFAYLHLPLRKLSRGYCSVTRTDTKIIFPRKALSWLLPILERYYRKRAEVVRNQRQQHLLVGTRTARSNRSVTPDYVSDRVRTASLRAFGRAVDAPDLRRTAADLFVQGSKHRGAVLTRMGFSSRTAMRFNYLERFPLQPKETHATKRKGFSQEARC